MTSSVFYKFKSQKEPSRIEFDGTGISVFELKRDIIIKSGLGDGTEFDLAIYNEDGNEEYDDDTTIIPRSTSIIARRLPPLKAGAGRAARYMTGKMPVNAKNSSRKEALTSKAGAKPAPTTTAAPKINSNMTEEERMAAMFAAQNEEWTAQQDEMANQAPVFRPGGNKKGGQQVSVPDHEPPAGYVCYRCGEKGHWIQVCPTNDDPNFDNKPRVKRTTGIPRSFLKTVEKPVALTSDGTTDDTKAPSGVMVNAEGEYVVAEPDKKSWEQFQAKTKSSAAAQKAAASGNKELQERGLECSIDKRMFIDPMKTPCCEKTYCNDCITNALIESDFTCPGCQTDEVLIDNLKPDDEMSKKIKEYLEEKEASKAKSRSNSPQAQQNGSKAGTPVADNKKDSKSPSPVPDGKEASKSQTNGAAKPASPNNVNGQAGGTPAGDITLSKKRPADELLENPKIPKGPKAMQQQAKRQSQPPMNGMPGMNFPGMPFDMSQFSGGGYGMGNVNMNMMNPYAMGMMGMGGNMMPMMGGMNGGFPVMNGMNGGFPNTNMGNMSYMGYGNGYGGGMGMNGGYGNGAGGGMNAAAGRQQGQFPNQQKTFNAGPQPSEEESAYFRAPVNQHRHRGFQKKQRPSDYREL